MVFRKMRFGWVKMNVYNLVYRKQNFTQFFSFNAELVVVDKAVYRL